MSGKRAGMTAGELMAQQAIDPEYQAMRAAWDRELSCIFEERRREQQPLLKDLVASGVVVDWVGKLCGMPVLDERVYPVLLNHIARPYTPWLSEWIGCAFGRKSARPLIWNKLLALIKGHALQKGATEGVLAAISEMARPDDFRTLIDLLSDRSLGPGRIYLVRNLMRSKQPEAKAALLKNRADPDLNKEITARLS